MWAVSDLPDRTEILGTPQELDLMQALLFERDRLGKLLVADIGNREQLGQVGSSELLDCFGVGESRTIGAKRSNRASKQSRWRRSTPPFRARHGAV